MYSIEQNNNNNCAYDLIIELEIKYATTVGRFGGIEDVGLDTSAVEAAQMSSSFRVLIKSRHFTLHKLNSYYHSTQSRLYISTMNLPTVRTVQNRPGKRSVFYGYGRLFSISIPY